MPRPITERYAGVLLCGDVVQSGYVPADEQEKIPEKYYLQVTAPGMNSYKVRMSDRAWEQYCDSGADMGDPCVLEVRSSVFNGMQYYSADSFHVRPAGRPAFVPKDAPGLDFVKAKEKAAKERADAVTKMEQAVKAGVKS